MVPRRVYVKGFMSYRDEVELFFDEGTLWALSGHNGAGKSAIFDAITYALFGWYRGQKNQLESLIINKSVDELDVEFDFTLDKDDYRAKRTLKRSGRNNKTCEIFHLQGPNSPRLGKAGPQPIPQTDSATGFEKWIKREIGLDEKTFTASVLLRQGKSDALLDALPSKRHDMLKQIVDLSAYERLHDKAKEKQKNYKKEADILKRRLEAIKPVDETEIEDLGIQIEEAEQELAKIHTRLRAISGLKIQAKQWAKLVKEQNELEQSLGRINSLLNQAEKIEQNAKRLTDLENMLPRLEQLLAERERLIAGEQYINNQELQARELQGVIEEEQKELEKFQTKLTGLQDKQRGWQTQKDDAQSTLIEMTSKIGDLEQLKQAQTDLETLEQGLARFPSDLDQQVIRIQEEVRWLDELKNAIGWLKQFAKARDDRHKAKAVETSSQEEISKLTEQMSAIANEIDEVQQKADGIKLTVDEHQQRITQLGTLLTHAKEQLEKFKEIEGQPTCNYCGQPLTPEHLETERQRLESEIQRIKGGLQEAENDQAKMSEEHSKLIQQVNDLNQEQQNLKENIQEANNKLREAKNKQTAAHEHATNALKSMPQNYLQKILLSVDTEWFDTQFPTQDDLDEMSHQIEKSQDKKRELSELEKQAKQRDGLLAQKQPLARKIKQLEEKYPPEIANHIRQTHKSAKTKQSEADAELENLNGLLDEAESAVKNKVEEIRKANEEHQEITGDIKAKKASQDEISRTIANIESGVDDEWQKFIPALSEDTIQTLKAEKVSISDANELWMELQQARNDKASQEKRLADVEQDLSHMPEEAKRTVDELEEEEQIAYGKQEEVEQERNQAQREKQELESRQKNRENLEKDRRKAEKFTKLYKRLADLLGPNYLQRHLLTQSEIGIVANANEILDRVSGGKLWLDFQNGRRSQDDGQATATKALDVVAYNRETSDEPIDVSSLSGGQRFRVSISFALGIGQYLSRENKRVESVIIDEGFGGLDETGLKEVIDELYYLKDSLKRIIVVSHQEEFTNAFKNRYDIWLEDRTSRVERVQV